MGELLLSFRDFNKLMRMMEDTIGYTDIYNKDKFTYKAWKNSLVTAGKDALLEKGIEAGLLERTFLSSNKYLYSVTKEGAAYLGSILMIEIIL